MNQNTSTITHFKVYTNQLQTTSRKHVILLVHRYSTVHSQQYTYKHLQALSSVITVFDCVHSPVPACTFHAHTIKHCPPSHREQQLPTHSIVLTIPACTRTNCKCVYVSSPSLHPPAAHQVWKCIYCENIRVTNRIHR
jgi:hypothetical protein